MRLIDIVRQYKYLHNNTSTQLNTSAWTQLTTDVTEFANYFDSDLYRPDLLRPQLPKTIQVALFTIYLGCLQQLRAYKAALQLIKKNNPQNNMFDTHPEIGLIAALCHEGLHHYQAAFNIYYVDGILRHPHPRNYYTVTTTNVIGNPMVRWSMQTARYHEILASEYHNAGYPEAARTELDRAYAVYFIRDLRGNTQYRFYDNIPYKNLAKRFIAAHPGYLDEANLPKIRIYHPYHPDNIATQIHQQNNAQSMQASCRRSTRSRNRSRSRRNNRSIKYSLYKLNIPIDSQCTADNSNHQDQTTATAIPASSPVNSAYQTHTATTSRQTPHTTRSLPATPLWHTVQSLTHKSFANANGTDDDAPVIYRDRACSI